MAPPYHSVLPVVLGAGGRALRVLGPDGKDDRLGAQHGAQSASALSSNIFRLELCFHGRHSCKSPAQRFCGCMDGNTLAMSSAAGYRPCQGTHRACPHHLPTRLSAAELPRLRPWQVYLPSFFDGSERRLGRPWEALRLSKVWYAPLGDKP